MSSFVLIPWAQTTWSEQGRVATRTPLPLSEEGCIRAGVWGEALAPLGIHSVYSNDEQTALETARIVADRAAARSRIAEGLAEIDIGLWEGLTTTELKRRYPKVFKRWLEDPSSVCPPSGESTDQAACRLRASVERIARKGNGKPLAVVLGPLAFGAVRCSLESVDLDNIRSLMHDEPLCYELATGDHRSKATIAVPAIRSTFIDPDTSIDHGTR